MTITDERQEQIDFVPYITVGTGIVVPAGNPSNIHGLDDLCGLTVAVQVGTIQVDMLNEQNDKCAEPINVVTFDTNPLAVEDLRTGGADANFSDFPVAAEDAAQSGGDLEVVDPQVAPEPYGIGLRKESTELNGVIADAIQAIRDSGKYDQILAEGGLEAVALREISLTPRCPSGRFFPCRGAWAALPWPWKGGANGLAARDPVRLRYRWRLPVRPDNPAGDAGDALHRVAGDGPGNGPRHCARGNARIAQPRRA